MSYLAPISAMPDLRPIQPITVRARELDPELMALLAKAGPLTAQEWAYLEAVEERVGAAERSDGLDHFRAG